MSRGPEKKFDPEVALFRAMEVFWARGYEAASLSELLEHMGIGKKSLYDTFGNKRSLFLKALEHYAKTESYAMRAALLAPGSPLQNLQRVLQNLQRVHALPCSKGCLFGTSMADFDTSDEEVAALLRHYLQQVEDAFYTTLTQAQAVGELSPTANPRDLARLLLCTTQGMALIGRVVDSEAVLKGAVDGTLALLD
ncbi:MAG: TetR/AcrR family transcriptional regulator [Cyanobacteria bacterium Co-bin8]|nr:TetR/AcrR family transcriptional regulator [Cyanobacteria bacterium Co-bin8]